MMLIDIQHKGISTKNPRIGEFVIIVLEQARRRLGMILWRDSEIFGKNFSDGQILSAILLESRSKLSYLGRRVQLYLTIPRTLSLACSKKGYCAGAVVKQIIGYAGKNVRSAPGLKTESYPSHGGGF
jgi:hypothetical protein